MYADLQIVAIVSASLSLRVLNFTRTRVKFFLPIRRQPALQAASRDTTHLTWFVFSFCISNLPAPKIVAFFAPHRSTV